MLLTEGHYTVHILSLPWLAFARIGFPSIALAGVQNFSSFLSQTGVMVILLDETPEWIVLWPLTSLQCLELL